MASLLLLSLTLILFFVKSISSQTTSSFPCNSTGFKQVDEIYANLIIFNSDNRKFPTNNEETTKYCSDNRQYSARIKDFSKTCLTGISKSVFSVALYSFTRMNKKYCNNAQRRFEYYDAGKCGNQNRKAIRKCSRDMVNGVLNGKNADDKVKIPIVCCEVYKWKSCVNKVYRDVGDPICTTNRLDFLESLLDQASVDPLKVVCSDYDEDSDKCSKLLATMPKTKAQNKNNVKSQVMASVQLLNTIK